MSLNASQVTAVISEVPSVLRAQQAKIAELADKVAGYEKRERVEKLARLLEDKGLMADASFEEKVASLNQQQSLDTVEEAIKMSAPRMDLALSSGTDSGHSIGGETTSQATQHFVNNVLSIGD